MHPFQLPTYITIRSLKENMSTHFRDISDALHHWYDHVRWKIFKITAKRFSLKSSSFAVNSNFLCSFMTNSCKEMRRRRKRRRGDGWKDTNNSKKKEKRNKWKVGKKMSNISDKTETSACDQLQEEQRQDTKTIHLLISTQRPEMFLAEGQFFHSSSWKAFLSKCSH